MHAYSTKVAKTEKVDRETPSGSEYPRRMRCAKLHLMLPAHQASEAKRTRGKRERIYKRTGEKETKRRNERTGATRIRISEEREKEKSERENRDNKRGSVATLLIENSSVLAILIKS